MSDFSGFVIAGAQLGITSVLLKPAKRGFYGITLPDGSTLPDIVAHATIEERHTDDLEITQHPVEQGAMITDHAFKRPAHVTLHLGWSNSPASHGDLVNPLIGAAASINSTATIGAAVYGAVQGVQGLQSQLGGANAKQVKDIYESLLKLQSSRALFTLFTGKRKYENMVCKTLSTTTDFKTEYALPIIMECQQIIIVKSETIILSKDAQRDPSTTASPIDGGVKQVASKTNTAIQTQANKGQ